MMFYFQKRPNRWRIPPRAPESRDFRNRGHLEYDDPYQYRRECPAYEIAEFLDDVIQFALRRQTLEQNEYEYEIFAETPL